NKLLAIMLANKVESKIENYLREARNLIASGSSSLPQRFQGSQPHKLVGGLSISLDIKKAFDSLPHDFLRESMLEAGFEPQEINLVMHLHERACLQVGRPDESADIFLGTGVRQGCSLSPLLWALITGKVYRMFQAELRSLSLPEGLINIFADDFFGSWLVQDSLAFAKAIRAIGVLVATLQKAGLQLSMEKTVILLALGGTSAPSVLAKHRKYIEDVPHLVIPVGQSRLPFQIVTTHRYLGAKLAYKGFELLNLRHRLDVAWGSFWRLHHIFKSRALGLGTKVRLWKVCVFSVLRYSLHSVGLPSQGPLLIRQAVNRQLRMIARSPAHLWHIPSAEILQPPLLLARPGTAPWLEVLRLTFQYSSADSVSPADIHESSSAQDLEVDRKSLFVSIRISPDTDARMDLEGVSRDELLEAAAELQHIQTMAIQGQNFFGPAQGLSSAMPALPPTNTMEVQTPPRHSEVRQQPRPSQFPSQPKYPKTNGKGTDQGKGQQHETTESQQPSQRGRARPQFQGQQHNAQPSRSGNPRSRTSGSDSLVEHMAQLLIRHDNFWNGMQMSTGWIMFLGTAPPLTTLPLLHQIGTEWHRMKAEEPSSLQQPMRVILYQTWANEMRKRVHELQTDQEKMQEAIRRGIITETSHFKFVQWNKEAQALQEVPSIAPLSIQEVLSLLDESIVLSIVDGVLINFHPTRTLAENMTGPTVTFSLTVGLREPKAFRFWSIMEALSGNASLQLVATTLRRERRQRSALAQTIAQELRRRRLFSTYANLL
ncbi:RXLR78, partial [Symbiodinium sp. CCMP2456]